MYFSKDPHCFKASDIYVNFKDPIAVDLYKAKALFVVCLKFLLCYPIC